MTLRISDTLSLPKEAVTWVLSFLAKRGAGKTYAASVLAEEMLKANIPVVVIDGMGTWYGLRVSSDGFHPGLAVVVFGGEHADLPLVPEKAAEIARAVVESNISCVLDLSPFPKHTARKIVADFLNELYRLNRVERHVFIEEADLWAPQKPIGPEENLCLSAVDNSVRRGGNHNLGYTLISQRSAVLNKNILTQSDCLVVLRTLAPQDKKAIQSWVEEQTDQDKKELNQWYDSLKSLENGEAWVWHPEKPQIFMKVKFRQRETFHATREFIRSPRASKIVLMDVAEFISRFKNVFEAKTPEEPKSKVTIDPTLKDLKAEIEFVNRQWEKDKKEKKDLKADVERLDSELEKATARIQEQQKWLAKSDETISKLQHTDEDIQAADDLKKALTRLLPTTVCTATPTTVNTDAPSTISVSVEQPAITIRKSTPPLVLDDSSLEGKIAIVYAEGKLPDDKWFTSKDVLAAFESHAWKFEGYIGHSLDRFCNWGYFEKQMSGRRPDYRVRIPVAEARKKGLIKEAS